MATREIDPYSAVENILQQRLPIPLPHSVEEVC